MPHTHTSHLLTWIASTSQLIILRQIESTFFTLLKRRTQPWTLILELNDDGSQPSEVLEYQVLLNSNIARLPDDARTEHSNIFHQSLQTSTVAMHRFRVDWLLLDDDTRLWIQRLASPSLHATMKVRSRSSLSTCQTMITWRYVVSVYVYMYEPHVRRILSITSTNR